MADQIENLGSSPITRSNYVNPGTSWKEISQGFLKDACGLREGEATSESNKPVVDETRRWLIRINGNVQTISDLPEADAAHPNMKALNLPKDTGKTCQDLLLSLKRLNSETNNTKPALHPMFWGGVATSLAGLAVLANGVYFGVESMNLIDEAKQAGSIPYQYYLMSQQDVSAGIANASYVIGGITTAAGIALMLTGWLAFDPKNTDQTKISIAPAVNNDNLGATARLEW